MSERAELFLGIIAIAIFAIALVQVGVLIIAGLLARRLQRLVMRVEQELAPTFEHLNAIGRDASRAAAVAAAQVERVDRLFADVSEHVEQTLNSVQAAVALPAREGAAILRGFRAVIDAFRDARAGRGRVRTDDEDALFI